MYRSYVLIGSTRLAKLLRFRLALPLLALCTAFVLATAAQAQAPELFTAVPASQLSDATPAQTQAIDRLRQRPTTQSLELVRVNIDALRGDVTQLSMPTIPSLTLSKRSEDVRSPTDFTWYGTLNGIPGQATLVVHNGNITGSIQNQGTLYRIEPVGNGLHAIVKVDPTHFPPEHPPSFQQLQQRGDIRPPAAMQDTGTSDAPVGIDVMVPYTTAARNAVADIAATIQLAVAEANQSYVNSGIHIKLNLVDTFEVAYSETGKTFDTILADFIANPTVQSRRASSGADLSAMIIDQTDFCGLADTIMASASTAFAVVHYDCATGYYSFAHELGHLMGARHDDADDSNTSPFSYGHGFQHPSATAGQSFRTIMAYACTTTSCDPRVQYWSSPNVKYNGIATGTAATNDNVRVLNGTAGTVAAFNSPPGSDIGSIWRSTGTACSGNSCPGWLRLDNNGASVRMAAGGGNLYQLHNTGKIWKSTGAACNGNSCPGWQMLDDNGASVQIAAGGNDLFQLHNTGKIWKSTGVACSGNSCPGWQMLDNNAATVTIVAATGGLYQLHNTGKIWKSTGVACNGNSCPGWRMLDDNGATVAIVAAGNDLYQLHNTGKIWKYTGTPCNGNSCPGWQMLDNNGAALAIVAATGGLYQLHNTGKIWKYTGTPCNGNSCPGWQMLDDNAAGMDIVADGGNLFQLHNTGKIWKYTGTPCNGNSCPSWQMLDDNGMTGRIAAAGGQLYQMHLARKPLTRTRSCYECR
jgi:peptidyl-Asp metalloendopeptidase